MTEIKKPCPICWQETEGVKLEPFSKELLPRPFCGNKEIQLFTVPTECSIDFFAGCSECGARTRECLDHKMAIDVWNKRSEISHDTDAHDCCSENDMLAEQLAQCHYCGEKPLLFISEHKGVKSYIINCSNPYCRISFPVFYDFDEARDYWNNESSGVSP